MISRFLQIDRPNSKRIVIFLFLWFVINVLQAIFTDIHYDEAYYWVYSLNLDWGYFDHPPMVAVMARLGDVFFHSRLSIRFMSILMGVFVMWQVISYLKDDADNFWYLIAFVLSFPFISLHSAGFLLLPDAPLVFFFMIYLLAYRRLLTKNDTLSVLFFAFASAAMMYSKYHAAIIILLTILSNLKLLKNYKFWLSGILAIALFLPHLYWQYEHQFPTFQYHLSDRGTGFHISNLLTYLGSQIALSGILSGIFIVWLTFTYKVKNQFERTLQFIAVGFWLFFLLSCLKGSVEAHWTASSMIAVIILSFKALQSKPSLKQKMIYLILPSALVLLLGRVLLASDSLANALSIKTAMHNSRSWVEEIDSLSAGKPVLFVGNYQDVSTYSFYKNKKTPRIPLWWTRLSQYDIWKEDHRELKGKDVFAFNFRKDITWTSQNGTFCEASIIEDYYPYEDITIEEVSVQSVNDSIFFCFSLVNNSDKDFEIVHDSIQRLCVVNWAKNEDDITRSYLDVLNPIYTIKSGEHIPYRFFIKQDDKASEVYLHPILYSAGLRVTRLPAQEFKVIRE